MDQQEKQFEYDKEIDLMDYVKVILKRKRMILIVFLITIIVAGVFTWFSPKVYKIDTSLEIGTIGGTAIEDPKQVMEKINNRVYGNHSGIKAINPEGTNLIIIEIESKEGPEGDKTILEEINNLILEKHQEKIKIEQELLEKKILSVENDIELSEQDIERIKARIRFLEEEKKNLENKEKFLEQTLPYEKVKEQLSGSLFALLDLREKLAAKKQEIENGYLSVNSCEKTINSLRYQIDSLGRQIKDIRFTEILKASTISVKQRLIFNMVISAILGVFLGIFLAFLQEWWNKDKVKI